jgi:hypothetical protein
MSRPRTQSLLASLLFVTAVPLVWVACGGSKPPETPADEANNSGDSAAPDPAASAASDDKSGDKSADKASDKGGDKSSDNAMAPAADSSPPATPPPPAMSDSDCGKCIDKVCAKPAAACGKNSDCQSTLDSFHSCGSDKGAAACISAASLPTTAKPKKLAAAYETCAKKASTSKTCKAKCGQ